MVEGKEYEVMVKTREEVYIVDVVERWYTARVYAIVMIVVMAMTMMVYTTRVYVMEMAMKTVGNTTRVLVMMMAMMMLMMMDLYVEMIMARHHVTSSQ